MSTFTHVNTTMDLKTFTDRFVAAGRKSLHPDQVNDFDDALIDAAKTYYDSPDTCDSTPEQCGADEVEAWQDCQ
jgi:hypothetical protein